MVIADHVRQRRAEDCDRRREDDAGTVALADRTRRLEELPRAVEIDPIATLEVSLGLARDHRGEVEDDVWTGRQQTVCGFGDSKVGNDRLGVEGRRRWLRGLDNVDQRDLADGRGPERAVARETLDKPAAEHPRGAEDQDAHSRTVVPSRPSRRPRARQESDTSSEPATVTKTSRLACPLARSRVACARARRCTHPLDRDADH